LHTNYKVGIVPAILLHHEHTIAEGDDADAAITWVDKFVELDNRNSHAMCSII